MRPALLLPMLLAACTAPVSNPAAPAADIEIAQAAPEGEEATAAPAAGLFAFLGGPATPAGRGNDGGPSAGTEVSAGTLLPFGQVARVCSVSARERGNVVDRRGNWKLHDTVPNSAGPRVMYLAGASDRCSQMFTAALALFGTATAHETVRYSTPGRYTETDEAYETIKGRICGVRRGAPCPSDRIARLEKHVTFVTAYPGFGGSGGPWLEVLLHNGTVVASNVTRR